MVELKDGANVVTVNSSFVTSGVINLIRQS